MLVVVHSWGFPRELLLYEEVNTMRTDLYSLEWEMNHRVTSAHGQKQRDRLARLCLEAQEAEPVCRRKRGDLRAGKLPEGREPTMEDRRCDHDR